MLMFLCSMIAMLLFGASSPVFAGHTSCFWYAFDEECCLKGNMNAAQFSIVSEVQHTHSCIGFNSSASNDHPVMFGTWEYGKLHVRLMSGLSSGLCSENSGTPAVGYCTDANSLDWSWTDSGCSCQSTLKDVVCSNRKITESPAKPDCELQGPTKNDYYLYSQEECSNYLSSIGL